MGDNKEREVIIIGAGPAGLTAGYHLSEHGIRPIIIEQLSRVGGISRTENYKGFYFDMGGHRFFSKYKSVNQFWEDILGSEFLTRPRLSRILYQNHLYNYPLRLWNTLVGMGLYNGIQIIASYIKAQIKPYPDEQTFEQWVTNRFGKRLFEIFFKSYTEKVWGIPTTELRAEFAAQRIKNLSLSNALISMFVKPNNNIVSLIEEFKYPRFGPGMLWERVQQDIEKGHGEFLLNTSVNHIKCDGNRITSVEISHDGINEEIQGTDFISSMPLCELIQKLDSVPENVLQAAQNLRYRDFITVCLIIKKRDIFPDDWIYVHSPGVKVGRIQNFKNWSPSMVPDPEKSSLGLEYFCNKNDTLSNMTDTELIELGKKELHQLGLANAMEIEDGCVYRVEKAYPIYDTEYHNHIATIRGFIDQVENLQTIGRNGLHQYNNQDHSMITGIMAVRNIIFGEQNSIWEANGDHHYHEEINIQEQNQPDILEVIKKDMIKTFPRIDTVAFGLAVGIISGIILFIGTLFLIIKDGPTAGANLQLLSNFFPGYRVNLGGSFLGLLYGTIFGFITGWTLAFTRNICVYLTAFYLDWNVRMSIIKELLDEL